MDSRLIALNAQKLRELYYNAPGARTIDSSNAHQQYRELNTWNRETHNRLIEVLERPYVELMDRVMQQGVEQRHRLRQLAPAIPFATVPYSIASLPPNLFNHCDRARPFLPNSDEEAIKLVSEYLFFSRRTSDYGLDSRRKSHHTYMDSYLSHGLDILLDLKRRRQQGGASSLVRDWADYNSSYKSAHGMRPTVDLLRNATYIAYSNNRRFTEEGGFFDKTDGKFNTFLLADFNSKGTFTSQIRAPIGWYSQEAAKSLMRGTYILITLVDEDARFVEDIRRIAAYPEVRALCQQHLMRSRDAGVAGDPVEYGIKQTMFEGIISVSALFGAIIEADGIPGYEGRGQLWDGIHAVLNEDVPVKITSAMAQAVVVPATLHGNYFRKSLVSNDGHMRVRPEVAEAWHEIHQRRTAVQHAAWLAYRESGGKIPPPVRFGLHCPFKAAVVRKTSEALMMCRAIATFI